MKDALLQTPGLTARALRYFRRRAQRLQDRFTPPPEPFESVQPLPEADFLQLFDLPEVRALLEPGAPGKARAALIEHFRTRPADTWPSLPLHMCPAVGFSDEELLREADALLSGHIALSRYPDVRFEGDIDWHHNPTSDPRARWTRELHRHRWWGLLAEAYRRSGDERYAEKLGCLVTSWAAAVPPPAGREETNVAWTLMGVGIRGLLWPAIFGICRESGQFTDDARLTMLKAVFDQAEFLSRFQTHNNHLLREANGLASLALCFPEFEQSGHWLRVARERLTHSLEHQVNADGSHFELTTGYQLVAMEEFQCTYQLFAGNDETLAQAVRERLSAMHHALAMLTRPDGTLTNVSDGYVRNRGGWPQLLIDNARSLGLREPLFAATAGREGDPPAMTSAGMPNAGWHIMRSAWDDNARYLFFDCGPFGGYHGHEDKLSIEVFAYGQAFLVDPGTYTYNEADSYRDYFVSSRAHNTLVPTGLSQVRRWLPGNMKAQPSQSTHGIRFTSEALDYVCADHTEGYGAFTFNRPRRPNVIWDMRHRRHVIFVRGSYWLVVDEVESESVRSLELLWHAPPGMQSQLADDGGIILHAAEHGPSLAIQPVESAGTYSVRRIEGSENPIQGWYSDGRLHHKTPAPAFVFGVSPRQRWLHATLLHPSRDRIVPGAVRLSVETCAPPARIAYRVETPEGVDKVELLDTGAAESGASADPEPYSGDPPARVIRLEA